MSWDSLAHADVHYAESELDTRRFGIHVSRLTVGNDVAMSPDLEAEVTEALAQSSSDVVVARWPARLTSLGGLVAGLGRRVIAADTLIYWDVSVSELMSRTAMGEDLETRVGVAAEDLHSVLEDSFRDYPSHYSANPAFPRTQVLEGYLEWARRTVETRPDDTVTLLHSGRAIGLATCLVGADQAHLEIELAGLVTAAQGGGRYATLLRGVAGTAAARDIPTIVISTQASNVRVQRAWSRAGFAPFAAFTTVHLVRE